jgi:hypothetical protein
MSPSNEALRGRGRGRSVAVGSGVENVANSEAASSGRGRGRGAVGTRFENVTNSYAATKRRVAFGSGYEIVKISDEASRGRGGVAVRSRFEIVKISEGASGGRGRVAVGSRFEIVKISEGASRGRGGVAIGSRFEFVKISDEASRGRGRGAVGSGLETVTTSDETSRERGSGFENVTNSAASRGRGRGRVAVGSGFENVTNEGSRGRGRGRVAVGSGFENVTNEWSRGRGRVDVGSGFENVTNEWSRGRGRGRVAVGSGFENVTNEGSRGRGRVDVGSGFENVTNEWSRGRGRGRVALGSDFENVSNSEEASRGRGQVAVRLGSENVTKSDEASEGRGTGLVAVGSGFGNVTNIDETPRGLVAVSSDHDDASSSDANTNGPLVNSKSESNVSSPSPPRSPPPVQPSVLLHKGCRVVAECDDEGLVNNNQYQARGNCVCISKQEMVLSPSGLKFDQKKMLRMKYAQKHSFKASRLQALRHDEPLPDYTDELIIKDMEFTYGPLDRDSEDFKMLFETFKESFLEQVEKCKGEEDKLRKACEDLEIAFVDQKYDALSTSNELYNTFTEEDCNRLTKLDPNVSGEKAEWLLLPRTKSFPPDDESKSKDEESEDDESELMNDNTTLSRKLNLAIFDPKYVNFPRGVKSDAQGMINPRILQLINLAIHDFPTGVGASYCFRHLLRKTASFDYIGKGFTDMADVLLSLPDVAFPMKSKTHNNDAKQYDMCMSSDTGSECSDEEEQWQEKGGLHEIMLFFPSALQPFLVSLNTSLTRLRHYVLIAFALSEKGYMSLPEIESKLAFYFGVKLDYEQWGFGSFEEMVRFVVIQHDFNIVTLESVEMSKLKEYRRNVEAPTSYIHFLVKINQRSVDAFRDFCEGKVVFDTKDEEKDEGALDMKESVTNENTLGEEQAKKRKNMLYPVGMVSVDLDLQAIPPPNCFSCFEKLVAISDTINPGQRHRCLIVGNGSPTRFWVQLCQNINMHNVHHQILQ